MNQLKQPGQNFHDVIHPLSRLLVTFWYILAVVSFPKYDWPGLAGMILYILIQCTWYEVPWKDMLRRIWPVFFLTGMVGIANPLFDREVYVAAEYVVITNGMVSMAVLMLKGIFCVMASYILVSCIGIQQICYALQCLHLPAELIAILLLIHRYFILLMHEAECMKQAYQLRAPGQKGLHFTAWGSFVGLLLLRSIDRAEDVYESMLLRGFHGRIGAPPYESNRGSSIAYVFIWGAAILMLRIFPVFQAVGRLL